MKKNVMRKWIIVKLAATLLCVNSFALDRYEREEIDRVMTEIYDQAEHTGQFIGAWNKAQDLLQAVGGIGGHKEARPENSRLRALLDCKDLSEAEKGFLYMRGLLCAAPGLLKVREQAEKLSLRIGFGGGWELEEQRWWRHCFLQVKNSLDPVGLVRGEFSGGLCGWAMCMKEAGSSEDLFCDLFELFQRITEESPQVDSFFLAGEAHEFAQYIIRQGCQPTLDAYAAECHYAKILGIGSIPRGEYTQKVAHLRDLCRRWGMPQREVNSAPPEELSWPRIAIGLEQLVPHTEFRAEMADVLFAFKRRIVRSIVSGDLERCDDEGVVRRIWAVLRERPDWKACWAYAFRCDMLSESMKKVCADCGLAPLSKIEGRRKQKGVFSPLAFLGRHLQECFPAIEALGNDRVVQEYNRCVGMLQVAFPDLRCVENPRCQGIGLAEFITLASCCDAVSKHSCLHDLCHVLQDSLTQSWENIQGSLSAVFELKGAVATERVHNVGRQLYSRIGRIVPAMSAFPPLRGWLNKYREFDVSLNAGASDEIWEFID